MENYNLISAEVIADSLNQFGERITTLKLVFPRIILAEFNTHRMFNRNSASSRAIPFKKIVKMVQETPFIPIAWQKYHIGMQGTEYLSKTEKFNLNSFVSSCIDTLNTKNKGSKEYEQEKKRVEEKVNLITGLLSSYVHETKTLDEWWLFARDKAIEAASILYVFDVTKQLCNRLLEPFMYHTVLVTATEWNNFFELRCPQYIDITQENISYKSRKEFIDSFNERKLTGLPKKELDLKWLQINKGQAEIHMMALAEKIYDAVNESTPKQLQAGEWHIPFGDNIDEKIIEDIILKNSPVFESDINDFKIKIAVARCARISYETLGDNPEVNYEKDIKLHDDLLEMKHMSPFEHCAVVMNEENYYSYIKTTKAKSFTISNNDDIYIDGPISFKDCGWSRNFKGFKQYREIIE